MAIIDSYRNILTVLVQIDVNPDQSEELVSQIQSFLPRIKECAGFISANFHLSLDHGQFVNYAQWQSEDAYLDFRESDLAKEIEGVIGLHNPKVQLLKVVLAT